MDSTNGDAVRGAGLALLLLDNCNDALQWLARGTALEPEHVQGHIWLAQGYLKCKDVPRGKIEFNRVIEIDPTNKQASDGLALIRKFEDAQQKRAAQQSGSKR